VCVRVDDIERQVAVRRRHVNYEDDDEVEKVVDEFDAVGDGQGGKERAHDSAQLATS